MNNQYEYEGGGGMQRDQSFELKRKQKEMIRVKDRMESMFGANKSQNQVFREPSRQKPII